MLISRCTNECISVNEHKDMNTIYNNGLIKLYK